MSSLDEGDVCWGQNGAVDVVRNGVLLARVSNTGDIRCSNQVGVKL